ncbi:MAG TPA: ATP-binding protein [Nocardioidaceae bacterium]|nr:ATP-binding protein [Nocardioidaceae bacterium]
MSRRVVVLAGPSGSGKSRLADRLGLPVLRLDDFYRDGDVPGLPQLEMGVTDWDHPRSWDADAAVAAVERLCRAGTADVPLYSIPQNRRVGHRVLDLADSPLFVAEGIFAPEIVTELRRRGHVADAICVRHHRLVTFWRRLTRDLREHRKPPLVLLLRGLLLLRTEPAVVRRATTAGCVPLTPPQAERRLRGLLTDPKG